MTMIGSHTVRVRQLVGVLVAVGIFATGLIAATTGTAHACSCFGETNLGSIDADDLVIIGRVTAVDGEFPEPDRRIDYTVDIVLDPNENFAADSVIVTSSDNSASCGVSWSDGALVGATLYEVDGGYATDLCSRISPELIEIYDDYRQDGEDPTDYCRDQLGASIVTLSAATMLRTACNTARSSSGTSYFVHIDDQYYSQPQDALVTVEVGELVDVSPTPTATTTPAPTATPTPRPAPTAAPTSTPQPAATATSVTVQSAATVVAAAAPTAVVVAPLVTVVPPRGAADFGWSATTTSAQHASTVVKTGASVVHVGFTG